MEKEKRKEPYRLAFHLMPPVGWMNDPNGVCYYKGYYHVFFQYSPEDVNGGKKCWGHYRSRDLIRWEYAGVFLKPDIKADADGAYSGCAYTGDGQIEIFYTGNVKQQGAYDYITAGREANVIYTASQDGMHLSQEKQLLLTNQDYPSDYTCHVRDPKVWKQEQTYQMLLGGRKQNEQGAILWYESTDKKQWKYKKEITTKEPFGYMWECPDVIDFPEGRILMCCPQGVESEEFQYQNQYQSGFFIWEKDGALGVFQEWDMGFDFYAPQTFVDGKGRYLLIGWAGVPDAEYDNQPSIEEGWQHSMTVFRELQWNAGKILQYPVVEINQLRGETMEWRKDVQTDQYVLELDATQTIDIEIAYEESSSRKECGFAFGEDCQFLWQEDHIVFEFLNHTGAGRTIRRCLQKCVKKIRILKDRSMLEIYVNDGEAVFTTRYYANLDQKIELKLIGKVKEVTAWDMKGFEIV